MDEYTKLLYSLAGVAIVSFVGWVIVSIMNLKGDVKGLVSKGNDIKEMKEDLKTLTLLVYEIAGKLGIPIRRD